MDGYLGGRTGKPASINSSRSHVSFGDAAPPSTSDNAARSCRRPRAPGCAWPARAHPRSENGLARMSASRRATAPPRGRSRPRSYAVRAGVVDGEPRDASDLVSVNDVVTGDDACGWMWVAPDQFDGCVVFDPAGAVQCRGREPGEDSATARPQPSPPPTVAEARESSAPADRHRDRSIGIAI